MRGNVHGDLEQRTRQAGAPNMARHYANDFQNDKKDERRWRPDSSIKNRKMDEFVHQAGQRIGTSAMNTILYKLARLLL
ncbi:hypothetical protein [Chromobacterium vaccinii]|uniref:hypothetical protein n=1 Tax=Chromobacterium vaccinii TaxID=1108595 RepID=UPI0011C0356B|nr:hypothetical protein [Chromobacterium vaccinii]